MNVDSHSRKVKPPATYFPTYDANGNISEYLASNGSVAAHFEYDGFDNTVVNTDTNGLFDYRFSTKPLEDVTGLYYYGYRYYDSVTGRWPSRDPIAERGGLNLYSFVGNDGVNRWDRLGLFGSINYPVPGYNVPSDHTPPPLPSPQSSVGSLGDALKHWASNAGGIVPATSAVDAEIKKSGDYSDWLDQIRGLWEGELAKVSCDESSGAINRSGGNKSIGTGTQTLGTVEVKAGPYTVNWVASDLNENCEREVIGTGSIPMSYSDRFDFQWDPESPIKTFLTDVIPSWIAAPGTPFTITGSFTQNLSASVTQKCGK